MSLIESYFKTPFTPLEIMAHIATYVDTPIVVSEVGKLFKAAVDHPGYYVMPVVNQVFKQKYGLEDRELQLLFTGIPEEKVQKVSQQLQSQEQLLVGRAKGVPNRCLGTYAEYVHSIYSNCRVLDDAFHERLEQVFDPKNPLQIQLLLQLPPAALSVEQWGNLLVLAAAKGCASLVRQILSGPRAEEISFEWILGKALCDAATNGHIEVVQEILSSSQKDKIGDGEWGRGEALINAATNNHIELVKVILSDAGSAKIPVSQNNSLGNALMHASKKGHFKIVEVLLSHTQGREIRDENYYKQKGQALWVAAKHGHLEVMKLILSDPDSDKIPTGATGLGGALYAAAEEGHVKIVTALLSHPRSHEIPDEWCGLSHAVCAAAEKGYTEIVRALLSHSRSNKMTIGGAWGLKKALISAAENKHVEVVQALLSYFRNAEIPADQFGLVDAINKAAEKGGVEIIRALLIDAQKNEVPAELFFLFLTYHPEFKLREVEEIRN